MHQVSGAFFCEVNLAQRFSIWRYVEFIKFRFLVERQSKTQVIIIKKTSFSSFKN
jgi:hypothetical protein